MGLFIFMILVIIGLVVLLIYKSTNKESKPKKLIGNKSIEVFKDDDIFKEVYDYISNEEDIDFETKDNKSFTCFLNNKIWLSAYYYESIIDKKITLTIYPRIALPDTPIEGFVINCTTELNFSERNTEDLKFLIDQKIAAWKAGNIKSVESDRKKMIKKSLGVKTKESPKVIMTVDSILDKISKKGIKSITKEEKEFLEKNS